MRGVFYFCSMDEILKVLSDGTEEEKLLLFSRNNVTRVRNYLAELANKKRVREYLENPSEEHKELIRQLENELK